MIARVDKARKLDELVGCVEELLVQLPDTLDPQITALRDRVDDGIFDAWRAISEQRIRATRHKDSGAYLLTGILAVVALTAWRSAKREKSRR